MSEGEGGGKKGGILAAAVAGIGMLFAKGADDCARLGAKGAAVGHGAPLADDALRGAGRGISGMGDDALRGVGHGSGLADDALRGTGVGRGTGLGHGAVLDDELRGVGVMEESMGASRAGDVADEVAHQSLEVAVENLVGTLAEGGDDEGLDEPPGAGTPVNATGRPAALQRLLVDTPALLPLAPTTAQAYARVMGKPSTPDELKGLANALGGLSPVSTGEPGKEALLEALVQRTSSNPVGILGYAAPAPAKGPANAEPRPASTKGKGIQLALPDGGQIEDTEIHKTCLALRTSCVVLACDPKAGAVCAWVARQVWIGAEGAIRRNGTTPVLLFTQKLLEERGRSEGGDAITISRLEMSITAKTPRVVRSRIKKAPAAPAAAPTTKPRSR